MALTKATPRPIQDGIKDDSARAIPLEPQARPQYLPIFGVQAKKGPLTTKYTASSAMLETYGGDTFDEAKKYYSHQTAAVNTAAGNGQIIGLRRLADSNALPAGFCLAVEYMTEELPVYEREPDGGLVLDVNQDPVPVEPAQFVTGIKKRLVMIDNITAENYRSQAERPGTLTNNAGDASTIVPIASAVTEVGEYGNNVGFRFWAPTLTTNDPADEFVAEDQRTMLYRWQWYTREDEKSSAQLKLTLLQGRSVDFSLRKGATNPRTNQSFDKQRTYKLYERKGSGVVNVDGPVKHFHFYEQNIEALLELFYTTELAAAESQGQVSRLSDKHEINLLGAEDFSGTPFYGIEQVAGGLMMDDQTTHYLQGGDDGQVDEATLDTLMREWLRKSWDDPEEPLNDWAQHPFSRLVDTGFSLDTKYAMLDTLGRRGDFGIDICTQDLSQAENDIEAELSMGRSLRTRALLSPESLLHGTETCRVSIWGGMGTFIDSLFGRRLPTIIDIVDKCSKYLGAGTGIPNAAERPTDRENNSVAKVTDVTHTYLADAIKDTYWDIGINYCQYRDTSDLFWPAYQSVYSDDTSVLNSHFVMMNLIDVKKQMNYHWSINTGDDRLTDPEFYERSNADFGELVEARYDGRLDLTWNTVKTPADTVRGFSWTLDVQAAASNMRTVGQYNLTATRRE